MLKKRFFLGLMVGVSLAGLALGQAFETKQMTVEEMRANAGLIVDIRTPEEWAKTGVIDGAKLVTFEDPHSFIEQLGPDLADGRDLILVCRSGRRTEDVAEVLAPLIPNHIISVDGGMSLITDCGYKTVPPQ